jgi:hypothetical protein
MNTITQVVLDAPSRNRLRQRFDADKWVEWTWKGDHVTLNLGQVGDGLNHPELNGDRVAVVVDGYGQYFHRVVALRVVEMLAVHGELVEIRSANKNPHITLMVNELAGGKSRESNLISLWETIRPIVLFGEVAEVAS